MAKRKDPRQYQIRTRLDSQSNEIFNAVVARTGKSSTQIAREAILFYLQYQQNPELISTEKTYREDLKKSTNRMCSLLAKIALDLSTLSHFMFESMDDLGKETFKESYQNAVKRVKARVNKVEKEILDSLENELSN